VGNDDHHLKNISFLYDPVFKLTPCYDVLASSLCSSAMDSPMALPMLTNGEPENYRTMGNGGLIQQTCNRHAAHHHYMLRCQ